MPERVIPTSPGWWWALVDGEETALEVWEHPDDGLRVVLRPGLEVGVADERLIEGLESHETSDFEGMSSVEWLAPVATRKEVDGLRGAADPVTVHIAAKHPHVQPVRSFDLLRDAIRHIAATGPRRPLWAAVSDAVPHGFGVSASIAVALGLNPDETVGRVPPPLDEVCPLCGHDAGEVSDG